MNSIFKIINQLSKDDLKIDDIDNQLKIIVTRSKTEIINTISKESKIQMPQLNTIDDVKKSLELTVQILKKMGDVLGKNSRVIHVFAKKYAQDLKDHIAVINTNYMTSLQLVQNYSKFEFDEASIKERTNKIIHISQAMSDKTSQLSKLGVMQNGLFNSEAALKDQIDAIKSSAQHAEYLQIKNRIEQNRSEENKLGKEIDEEFSKISRPLGKYVYVTSLEKPLKLLMERLIQNPSKELTVENKDSIVIILESCMKGTISGSVSVKEVDKSVEQINSLIKRLDDFIVYKNNLVKNEQDLQSKLRSFDIDTLDELEHKLQKTIHDKIDNELKIKKLESELTQETNQHSQIISELTVSLKNISNADYVLSI